MADTEDTIARNGTGAGSIATADPLESEIIEAPAPEATTEVDPPTAETATESPASDEAVEAGDATPAGAPDVTPVFLSELSVAMMDVVGRERERVGAIVDADAEAHLTQARERAAEEEAAFRQVADEDVASIESWADAEVERIRADAAQRIENRRTDLDASLAQHDAVLQSEIEGIETAVKDYGATLDGFLDDLRATGDPAAIAAQASSLPRPPDLGEIRAVSRTAALTRIAEAAMDADPPGPPDREVADPAAVAEAQPVVAQEEVRISEDPTALDEIGLIGDTGDLPTASIDGEAVAETPVAEIDADVAAAAAEIDESAPLVGVFDASAPMDEPVAVMDPAATERTGWEMEPLAEAVPVPVPVTTATAVMSGDKPAEAPASLGHPNAAVRLIRSVAPWTAPTHHDGENGDQGSGQS